MIIKVAFRGATVKELRMAWQQALRAGNTRLVKRISALLQVSDGVPAAEAAAAAAARVGAGESTVQAWLRAFMLRRFESLRYGTSPGRPRKLTPTQRDRLKALVTAGPLAAGYPRGCWSSLMLQDLCTRRRRIDPSAPIWLDPSFSSSSFLACALISGRR